MATVKWAYSQTMTVGSPSPHRLHSSSFLPTLSTYVHFGTQFLHRPCKWSVIDKYIYCKISQTMVDNINLNQLHYLMNYQQAGNRTKIKDKFPLDKEKDIENSVYHPGSREVLAYIKTNPQKSELNKLMPRYFSELLDMCACQEEKSVCAKVVKGGETIAQCFDCRADASCIICMDCFKNGNHKGHRVIFKKAGGGCCDCGDIEAWKEEGFCSKHTGKIKQVQISIQERTVSSQILSQLYFILCWLKLSDNKFFVYFLPDYINFLGDMVRISIKGIKLISIFLDKQIPEQLMLSSKLYGSPFQQIFNADFLGERQFNFWEKLFIEMFPYYPFKQQLIANYIKCFSTLYASEHRKGESIACQIMTSYKLVQDYSESKDAVPIIIPESHKISEAYHKTKMMTYDINRINSLQGDAAFKYWELVIRYGIQSMLGYYQTLKTFARKQKRDALKEQNKKEKKNKKKNKRKVNLEQYCQMEDENEDDVSFSIIDFIQRNHQIIEVQYTILEEFIEIMPVLSQNQPIILELIRSIFTLLIDEIQKGDDLLIFRPYERLLGVALFFYSRQTPFVLSNPKLRQSIRQRLNISQQKWEGYLSLIQKRMLQTFGFFSHMQNCQAQEYHSNFYTYLMLYASKYCLLGHTDVLILRQLIFLGAPAMSIDFSSVAKLDRLEPANKWTLRSLQALITELGLLYIGSFTQIYISFYSEKSKPPEWLIEQAKRALRKFITAEGGSVSLQRVQYFSNNFLFKDQDDLKAFLKQLCKFNLQNKMFELLPANIDKQPINFRDYKFRTKLQNHAKGLLEPRFTLQFIDKANKILFINVWNQKNIDSLCQILLEINEDVQKGKDKDELVEYYSIPCRVAYFLRENEVLTNLYASLTDLLQTFEVPSQIRKELGELANFLAAPIEELSADKDINQQKKEIMRLKKLKKLEELKKKNSQNVQKIKVKHAIEAQEQANSEDECVICRKTGGNLVWVTKMSIRNLEKILQLGPGTLTLSFMSCYHAFHFECIQMNAIKRSTHEFLFRCPVCRSLGNVFLSIANKQSIHENMAAEASLDRIMHVAMTMREYTQFDIYEQIFKSFYHLVLLGFMQPQYVLQKRMKLYKQIVSILCNKKLKDHIKEIQRKLLNNQIVLEPKSIKTKSKAVNLNHEAAIGQADQFDDDSDYDSDEEQEPWEQLLNQPILISPQAQALEIKEGPSKKKNKHEKKQAETRSQPTPLFFYVLNRIIIHILKFIDQEDQKVPQESQKQEFKKEEDEIMQVLNQLPVQIGMKDEKEHKIEPFNPDPWAVRLLDELLDEKTLQTTVQLNSHTCLKIIPLPERFFWDLTDNKCNQCQFACPELFVCLLCNWKGCLNNCRKGGLKSHNEKLHGQSGAFLRLKDANAYLMSPAELNKIGCLYLNEWGEDFDQTNDWNKYTLQSSVVKRVVEMLIKNE